MPNTKRQALTGTLQEVVDSLRSDSDNRHHENMERFKALGGQVEMLGKRFDEHIKQFEEHTKSDREGMTAIANAIAENTRITRQTAADTAGLVEFWKGMRFTKTAVIWIASVAGAVAALVASVLYLIGRGPPPLS